MEVIRRAKLSKTDWSDLEGISPEEVEQLVAEHYENRLYDLQGRFEAIIHEAKCGLEDIGWTNIPARDHFTRIKEKAGLARLIIVREEES